MSRLTLAFVLVLAAVACNPTKLKPGYCNFNSDCASGKCDPDTRMCKTTDAGVDSPDVGDALDATDGTDSRDGADGSDVHEVAPPRCPDTISCADGGYDGSAGVCEEDAGICVQCLKDSHCAGPKTPICEGRLCRACKADTECPDPMICMADGHCATAGEVVYVEFNANGCPGANGTAGSAFCTPNEGVARLTAAQNVLVIRGATADRMTLNTGSIAPVIIGKAGASIPATAATAIQVSSDVVLIRDLLVTGGIAAGSKGIAATGSSTKLTLSNVQVNLTTDGLGIQADAGAQLAMDRCSVMNNKRGGILVDGAGFDIKNSAITGNGPGDDAGAAWGGLRLKNLVAAGKKSLGFLTVMSNNQVGVSCSGSVDATSVLVSGSSGGVDISPSCGFTSCGTAVTATCGAQP